MKFYHFCSSIAAFVSFGLGRTCFSSALESSGDPRLSSPPAFCLFLQGLLCKRCCLQPDRVTLCALRYVQYAIVNICNTLAVPLWWERACTRQVPGSWEIRTKQMTDFCVPHEIFSCVNFLGFKKCSTC